MSRGCRCGRLTAMRTRRRKSFFWRRPWIGLALLFVVGCVMMMSDCLYCRSKQRRIVIPPDAECVSREGPELLVTGYCNCGDCCGWRKKWFFFGEPVYNYGKMKGEPKKVGVTASGTVAAKGTIAADPAVHPFGTKIEVPGYGTGTVQDVGGSIKGAHIDLWFPTHEEALAWGAQKLKVKIEKPKAEKPKIQAEKQKAKAAKAKK